MYQDDIEQTSRFDMIIDVPIPVFRLGRTYCWQDKKREMTSRFLDFGRVSMEKSNGLTMGVLELGFCFSHCATSF